MDGIQFSNRSVQLPGLFRTLLAHSCIHLVLFGRKTHHEESTLVYLLAVIRYRSLLDFSSKAFAVETFIKNNDYTNSIRIHIALNTLPKAQTKIFLSSIIRL